MIRYINHLLFLVLVSTMVLACSKDEDMDDPIDIPDGYSLVWSDEFDGSSIDATKWQYETGDGTDYGLQPGWGNNELQLYTESADNSGIDTDGDLSVLSLTARTDGAGGYTSAKLTTRNLFSMRFGRVDVKAKMPQGQGIWPAIWMLGDNIDEVEWPGCGEVDIVEVLGHEPGKMYSTIHFTNGEQKKGETQGTYELANGSLSDDYHIYSFDWTPEKLTFRVDGVEVQQVPIDDGMKEFLRSFYLIMNVAVGGNWPGNPDSTTSFPQSMLVDYVRVFEKDDFTAPDAPALDIDEETIGQNIDPTVALHAINEDFDDLGNATVVIYGGGGEPLVNISDMAIDGDSCLVFEFPGDSWGGGYILLDTPTDLSSYDYVKFSLQLPTSLADAEIKLESPTTNVAVYLIDYAGIDVGQGYMEYIIPLSDFDGLDLTEVSIPFSMWNPKDPDENFAVGTVLIDNLHFTN